MKVGVGNRLTCLSQIAWTPAGTAPDATMTAPPQSVGKEGAGPPFLPLRKLGGGR
jgi:hypothetical protein